MMFLIFALLLVVVCSSPPSDDDASNPCACALPPQNNNKNNIAMIANINDDGISRLITIVVIAVSRVFPKKKERSARCSIFSFFFVVRETNETERKFKGRRLKP